MTDEEMVGYLARCQLDPSMPRPSIETLLHAFVPHPHVDHTHPDAIGSIVGAADGERLAEECFGADAVWIQYIRPGFALSKLVADAVSRARGEARPARQARPRHVGRDGGRVVCLDARCDQPRGGIRGRARTGAEAFGGAARAALDDERRVELLAEVLPALRGALRSTAPASSRSTSPEVIEFVSGKASRELSQVGAACPDHLVHTKRRPVFVAFDPEATTRRR